MPGWIEYDSNNSGGRWWLSDEDWKALEEGGWHVCWIIATKKDYSSVGGSSEHVSGESGHRYGETYEEATERHVAGQRRWPDVDDDSPFGKEVVVAVAENYAQAVALRDEFGGYVGGALAKSAIKQGEYPDMLIADFERITGQYASAEGCNCCGPPHSFTWHDDDGTTKHGSVEVTQTKMVWS